VHVTNRTNFSDEVYSSKERRDPESVKTFNLSKST